MPKTPPATDETSGILDAVAQKTAQALLVEAETRLKALSNHQKQITELQSNVDVLMKRYFVERSVFDRLSDWYGQKPWWSRAFIATSFVGLSALIGAVFNLGALFTVVAIGLYSAASWLFENHHRVSQARSRRFCEDIQQMEQDLKEAVHQLAGIEPKLNQVLIDLGEEQLRLSQENLALENTADELRVQTSEFLETVKTLNDTKDQLLQANQRLQEELDSLRFEMESSQSQFSRETQNIHTLNQNLRQALSRLESSQQKLESLYETYQARLSAQTTSLDEESAPYEFIRPEVREELEEGQKIMDEFDRIAAAAQEELRLAQLQRERTRRFLPEGWLGSSDSDANTPA